MKVAVFTESLPPKVDGVAHTMTKLAGTMQEQGVDFRFFCPFQPEESFDWSKKVVKVPSVPFLFYSYYRVGISSFRALREELDDFQPDIIHAAAPTPTGFMAAEYAKNVNIPAVSSYHTNFVSYFKYYGFDFASDAGWSYLKWFYNRFQKIYVPSHDTARELTSKGFDNVDLWQRGIELERFSPLYRDEQMRRELAPDGEPILLFVGRLVEEKDLSDLVAANNIMKQNGRKFKLVLVGDGPMRSELESQLPDAHFTGFQKGKDLSRWFATADIFTFPSTTETFGNVVLEAFASGIPAVGVDIGGQTDLIDSGRSGFIARANNPMDFAEKIQILLDNPTMRKEMADYARGYVKKYSWEAINTGLFNGYQSLISNISVN